MATYHLDARLAQDIVARTMKIIDSNVNVMDARGRIIGSGDRERIGELHEGALLVLSQGALSTSMRPWLNIFMACGLALTCRCALMVTSSG